MYKTQLVNTFKLRPCHIIIQLSLSLSSIATVIDHCLSTCHSSIISTCPISCPFNHCHYCKRSLSIQCITIVKSFFVKCVHCQNQFVVASTIKLLCYQCHATANYTYCYPCAYISVKVTSQLMSSQHTLIFVIHYSEGKSPSSLTQSQPSISLSSQ